MKSSRLKILVIGLSAGVLYAFIAMLIMNSVHMNVSISYIFVLPLVMGMIPVLFSTKEQLRSYKTYLLMPWGITFTFFLLCLLAGFDGVICLMIIVGPFLVLGSLGAFIFSMIKLKSSGSKTPLYSSLFLPFLFLFIESGLPAKDQYYTISTSTVISADQKVVWENIKNVRNIQSSEVNTHFVHLIGVPEPLDGTLNKEGVGGVRSITWQKGIKFKEIIKTWKEGDSFTYDIEVDPSSIPPATLDQHVMIGGRYFDVVEGGYQLIAQEGNKVLVSLYCKYRVTTNLNFYSRLWADFLLDDFNEMILEVIKSRCEHK
jgi:hypothetical protein